MSTKEALGGPPLQVAIVPTPGMGHLIPLLELAKLLIDDHGFFVTFLVPNDGSPMEQQKQLLQSQPTSISSIFLPRVSFDDLPKDVKAETRIYLSLTRSLVPLREAFKSLTESTRVVALVVDLFGLEALEIGKDLGVLPFVFYPTTAMCLSLNLHLPRLDQTYTCEYKDLSEPIQLLGCIPICGTDLVEPLLDRSNDSYKLTLQISKRYPLAAGVLVNSFVDLEPGAFKALMEENSRSGWPPIYPVGPLTRMGLTDNQCECLRWLDGQPVGSVLFVSFGSGGTLSRVQLNELALGLEMSGQKFLWVARSPHDKSANATYFGAQCVDNPIEFLPEGFLDRTKEMGLVVPSWAPQAHVLSHGSTGGFMSHCGWNSTLESIVSGVPIIAWPLYAEQRMNATLLADDLKVAIRVKLNEKGLVGREDIASYVRGLFLGDEGKRIKNKVKELRELAKKALSETGSSTKSLAEVANKWKNHHSRHV